MRRFGLFVVALLVLGCAKQPQPERAGGDPPADPSGVRIGQPVPAEPGALQPAVDPGKPLEWVPVQTEASRQEKYDAALLEALNLMAERKYAEALTSLEAARTVLDTEQVRLEIERIKRVQERQAAGERTVVDIQAVLNEGRAEVAAHLATKALETYGGTETAFALEKLKRQADALLTSPGDDPRTRQVRYRGEAEAAMRDRNLRAAVIAFDQALAGADAELKRQADEVRAALARYDEQRQKAAELRRDPYALEDALAALQDALKAWDTVQVRQEIDECNLMLQKRRDRVSVAEFEVRGEIGIPAAGRTVADDLLPAFKSRFDLVERGQLAKVVEELKLEQTDLSGNENGRREVGRLAKVRYLVVGSITPMSGILVQARLVDVRTGLVVQTAKVIAPTPEEMLAQLPQLATVLLMSDEEKIRWEQMQAQAAKVVVQPAQPAPLPPPPEVLTPEQPMPAPIVINTPRAPEFGGFRADDFKGLPPPPPVGGPAPVPVVVVERERPVKQKAFFVAIELGDNLFKRGRYREAHAQFEFAMNLEPGHRDVSLRLERCRPHLPPPPVVIVAPPPRPRLAILNFAEIGNPHAVPPGLGAWTAEHVGPYFCPPYEVVDRGEVFWWMGRLGLTVRDVVVDPGARRWLGRAMGVRFFLFGSLTETASFIAETHLVDAEYGCEVGSGSIHVRNPMELKLRLGELARLTLMPPQERVVYVRQTEETERILVEANRCSERGEFSVALEFFGKAQKNRPGSIEISVLIQRTNERARQAELEAARRREWERQQALAAEMQRRQWEIARAAEAARIRAEQEAASVAEAQRMAQLQQRERAHRDLYVQAQVAFRDGNFAVSINLFESALALKRSDEGFRELALARAKQQEAERRRAAEAAGQRELQARVRAEKDLLALRAQVEEERRQATARELARSREHENRDQAEYARLIDQGQRQMAQQKYDDAAASFQTARQLKKTEEVEKLVTAALVEQARASAQRKGQRERDDLERRLAQEKAAREKAEAEAKRNRELYTAALTLAQKLLAEQQYEESIPKFREAEKYYRTDIVLTGLRQAEEGVSKKRARAEAETRKKAEEERKAEDLRQKLAQAEGALKANQYDRSLTLYSEALKVSPGNVDALAGQSKAQQLKEESATKALRAREEKERRTSFRTLLSSGKANLAAKQYDAAVLALTEATKLDPADAEAKAALAEAQKAKSQASVDAKAAAEAKRKADEHQKWMGEGRVALSAKQYDAAIRAFREAGRVLPGDQSAAAFLKEAEAGKAAAVAAVAAEAKKKEEEQKRSAEVQKYLVQGRAALGTRDLDGADKAFAAAAKLAPDNPEVAKARADLQTARTVARAEAEGRRKKLDDYQGLVRRGREAMTAKRYDEAVKLFTDAAALMPEDGTAQTLQKQAEKARDDARIAAERAAEKAKADADAARRKQDEEQRQRAETMKRQQVADLVAKATAATKAGRLDAAAQHLAEASKLAPQDPGVAKAQQELTAARAAAKTTADAEAAKQKKQADYRAAMQQGRTALGAKRYDEAARAFAEAGRIMPGDRDAAAMVQEVEKARAATKATADAEAKRQQEERQRKLDYDRRMTAGRTALEAKRFEEAVTAFGDALKARPNDAAATKALDEAKKALEASKAPPKPPTPMPTPKPPPPKPEVKPQPPTPRPEPKPEPKPPAPAPKPEAKPPAPPPPPPKPPVKPQPKPEAKPQPPTPKPEPKPAPAPKPPTPAPNPAAGNRAEFDKQMQAAAALEGQQKFADAEKAYREASRLMPGDATATAKVREMSYRRSMAEGNRSLAAKRFDMAVREFEYALKMKPNDPEATAALKRAREGR